MYGFLLHFPPGGGPENQSLGCHADFWSGGGPEKQSPGCHADFSSYSFVYMLMSHPSKTFGENRFTFYCFMR